MKAAADADSIDKQYVIGNGGQNFWGWLTFDVEAGEEYWVFQHSSQIGFGGFEFHEGKTADELKATETVEDGGHIVFADEELHASCSISIQGMINVLAKAVEMAR